MQLTVPTPLTAATSSQQQLLLWQQLGIIRPLDLALVQFCAQSVALPNEAAALLLPWLALASAQTAQGHLCLDLTLALQQPASLVAPQQQQSRLVKILQQWLAQQSWQTLSAQLSAWPQLVQVLPQSMPQSLPKGLLAEQHSSNALTAAPLAAAQLMPAGNSPFVLAGERLYLRRFWQYEQQISQFIQQRQQRDLLLRSQINPAQMQAFVKALFTTPTAAPNANSSLIDWQCLACALAASSSFAVITGGPGTGKTTTVLKLLLLLQQLALSQGQPLQIRLAAPTGKAAARLGSSVAQALGKMAQQLQLPAELLTQIPSQALTLHRLLGTIAGSNQFRHHAANPLPLDILVIDEASMVDVALLSAVLQALPAQARLILLGDKDQLASVEAGAVLAEICRHAEAGGYSPETAAWLWQLTGQQLPGELISNTPHPLEQHIVMLRTSHRFSAHSGIGQLAAAVQQGDSASAVAALQQNSHEVQWLKAAPGSQAFADLLLGGLNSAASQNSLASQQQFADTNSANQNSSGLAGYFALLQQAPSADAGSAALDQFALSMLSQLSQFQLLAAVRQGSHGVEQLNKQIEQLLARRRLIDKAEGWYLGRPVLVLQNDYSTGLMNGDLGICLQRPGPDGELLLSVAFSQSSAAGQQFQPKVRWFLPGRLPSVESAFALTVHKSQGSEFQHVVLILPEHNNAVLTRELIYTGVTRAAARFTLVCADETVLIQAINTSTERRGGLRLAF